MSASRAKFLEDLDGLESAINAHSLAQGAAGDAALDGIYILRRGILVTSLIMLETFLRERTRELLERLSDWPAGKYELPDKLRQAALFHSLPHLHKYAKMLKSQGEDYFAELLSEAKKISRIDNENPEFTRFIAGDLTGNISSDSVRDLVKLFQVDDCWRSFQSFSSDIGLGVPSVEELVKDIVRKRHRSAHVNGYRPTASDISELKSKLICAAICFDTAMSVSIRFALAEWRKWAEKQFNWRDQLELYFLEDRRGKFRVYKINSRRALKVADTKAEARQKIPKPPHDILFILIEHDDRHRPVRWDLIQ